MYFSRMLTYEHNYLPLVCGGSQSIFQNQFLIITILINLRFKADFGFSSRGFCVSSLGRTIFPPKGKQTVLTNYKRHSASDTLMFGIQRSCLLDSHRLRKTYKLVLSSKVCDHTSSFILCAFLKASFEILPLSFSELLGRNLAQKAP